MAGPRRYDPAAPGQQPAPAFAAYASTATRAPRFAPIAVVPGDAELARPGLPAASEDARVDLSRGPGGAAIGERIVVGGRILDEDGCPVPGALIELWQANAAGRYRHGHDTHDAPLDPNFTGAGRMRSAADGSYAFTTVRPGAYPWGNHPNAWRPQHIHFSLFGPAFASRLVTQMYFPGDPLLALDPIFMSTPEKARDRLVANFVLDRTEPMFALGYEFDFVLRGPRETPTEA